MSVFIFIATSVILTGLIVVVCKLTFGEKKQKNTTKLLVWKSEKNVFFWSAIVLAVFFASLGFGLLYESVSDVLGDFRKIVGIAYVEKAVSHENEVAFMWACILHALVAAIGVMIACYAKGWANRLKIRLSQENLELEALREKEYAIESGLPEKYQKLVCEHENDIQQLDVCEKNYKSLQVQFEKLSAENQKLQNSAANSERRDKLLELIRAERDSLKARCEEQEYDIKILNSQLQIEKVEKEIAQTQISLYLSQEKNDCKENAERSEEEMPILDDQENLRDYAFYEGVYDSFPSETIKEKLYEIRNEQKNMIQEKTAAYSVYQFNVDGSIVEGRKVTKAVIKQAIGAFNAECDLLISQVKFYNIERIKNRIVWSYNKINKENEATNVEISEGYLQLKLDEVSAVFEYTRKKKEEADYAKEQRAIAREEARVMKELEEERARIEKEQTHYENRLARLEEQLAAEESEPRKELIKETITAVKEEIVDLDKALKEVDYRQANQRAGYVYVISNVGSFGEGVYKIGMTRRLQPEDRVDELGGASVPFRFDTHAMIFSKDAPALETALHNEFRERRVNMVNGRKEFFRVPLDEIERVVNKYHDKTVKFDYTPIAEQYRETQKLIERSSV